VCKRCFRNFHHECATFKKKLCPDCVSLGRCIMLIL
jgi:hypothetical protein